MPRGAGLGADFEVYLEFADGRRLEEHRAESYPASGDRPARTDVWMVSEYGKQFKIVILDSSTCARKAGQQIMGKVHIDGRYLDLLSLSSKSKKDVIKKMIQERDGKLFSAPLAFSAIDTVDGLNEAQVDGKQASQVGSIKLALSVGTWVWKASEIHKPAIVADVGTLWEKHAKMGSTIKVSPLIPCRAAAEGTPYESSTGVNRFTYGSPRGPMYEFNIKYCERVVVDKTLGIEDEDEDGDERQDIGDESMSDIEAVEAVNNARARNPRKRKAPSPTPSCSSSSSSSASSAVAGPGSVPSNTMIEMFKMFIQQQEVEAERKRKEEQAKKAKKAAKKQKKRAAKAKRRQGKRPDNAVDLTWDTDQEEESAKAKEVLKARGGGEGRGLSKEVKQELVQG